VELGQACGIKKQEHGIQGRAPVNHHGIGNYRECEVRQGALGTVHDDELLGDPLGARAIGEGASSA
jgi:hypothetical protein